MRPIAAAALLLLAGCAGYDPPMAGDHSRPSYQAALTKCQTAAQARADKIANATPHSAVVAMFASDDPKRRDIEDCMKGRGYRIAAP